MPQTILRVAVALVTFGVGATASTIYNAIFGSALTTPRVESVRPAPFKAGCSKSWRSRSELPPPPPAVAPDLAPLPDAPPPPAAKPPATKRITIKLPDGTVRVIESGAETVRRKL